MGEERGALGLQHWRTTLSDVQANGVIGRLVRREDRWAGL